MICRGSDTKITVDLTLYIYIHTQTPSGPNLQISCHLCSQWDRHDCHIVQTGLQRGGRSVQDGCWNQHIRPGLRHSQALRSCSHQHHSGVCASNCALLQKDWTLQTSHTCTLMAPPLLPHWVTNIFNGLMPVNLYSSGFKLKHLYICEFGFLHHLSL